MTTTATLRAADPRVPSTELGELVELELQTARGRVAHTFTPPRPLLAYHEGGLLIAGGSYRVEGDAIRNVRGARRTSRTSTRGTDAKAVAAARARYVRDHWGQEGPRTVSRLPAADPRRASTQIGELVAVVYRTKKGTDRVLTDYRHPFSKPRPVLSHHPGGLLISGGVYHVTTRGIID